MAGNQDLRVTYAAVEQTAADIERAAKELQAELDKIWAAVKRVSNAWEGEAHQAFQAAERQWNSRASHIQSTLHQVSAKVRAGSADYQATDRRAAGFFH
ncbi:WXG100 family type VII secretion target [Streptomyces sp. MST-110588]|uniref:WXG100 family type VII secretion target n=1 Tax=Streptomyces sp. MST-110588 TaxID=2833628 RepID=UPI001F5CE446|nr:WXG100 family type VII secretion target [Streptomyces sp. MST-110588]UNO41063.1 WXG100 family type VII secretion target [Streptomyces sp. MST-110588]